MASDNAPLRVRTGKGYPYAFDVLLGQRNAEFVRGFVTPHTNVRIVRRAPFVHRLQGLALIEPGYDLLHVKNAVPLFHAAPFVVTFEDFLPRVPTDYYSPCLHRLLFRALCRSRCRRIIAESAYALRQFEAQNHHFPDFAVARAKTEILLPAIAPRADRPKTGPRGRPPRLLFVGRDFLRKGGGAMVRAHEILRRRGAAPETHLVTDFRWRPDDYVGPRDPAFAEAEHDRARQDGIVLHGRVGPDEVARLMADADLLVLPTFHDTFGYVVLEALASGTPVVATRTCALPEVIDEGRDGWLLPFENENVVGRWEWLYRTREPGYLDAFAATVDRLASGIADRVAALLDPAFDYEEASAAALAKIGERFSVARARDRLEAIYDAAAGRAPA